MRKKFLKIVSTLTLALTVLSTSQVNAATLNKRLEGKNRYETGARIVSEGWTTSNYAVIASGEGFADALCAAPLAKKYNAPILLTEKNTLDLNTKNQLKTLNVKNVFIVGGPGVVSDNVNSEIKGMNIETNRIYGQDRFETCLQIAKSLGDINGVVVTNGFGFADALSIAPVAAQKGMPILLTDKSDLSQQVKEFLANKSYKTSYIVGGNGVVSNNIASQLSNVTRLGGNSRYETNAAVLNHFGNELSYNKVYVASGENYPDALSGSALASLNKSPLILVGNSIDPSVMSTIKAQHDKYSDVVILGGSAVVSDVVATDVVTGYDSRNSLLATWGLGIHESEGVSNNKPYDWYIDQATTGAESGNNCGPSSVTMAIKWKCPSFNKTAEQARNTYRSEGGWWYTSDIMSYLTDNNVKYEVISKVSTEKMKEELKQGKIMILCLDTTYLTFNDKAEERTGKFYGYSGGHFLVVKGYKIVDNKVYFETYDPNNWYQEYSDGTPKGKDRYYSSEDIINAAENHWNNMIVVQ